MAILRSNVLKVVALTSLCSAALIACRGQTDAPPGAAASASASVPATPQAVPQRPDINGTWERTPDNWYGANPDEPVLPGGPMPMKEPYASQYAALKKKEAAANAAGKPIATTSTKCLPEGMPTLMAGLFPLQIIGNEKVVVVLGEYLQQVRRIWLNDTMPPDDELQPSFQGRSVGRWDGDTLVVETRGVRTDVTFYDVPHGKGMKITERLHLVDPNKLVNEVVVDDPETLKAPYKFTFEYKRSDYKIQEYVCENNQIKVNDDGTAQWKPVK